MSLSSRYFQNSFGELPSFPFRGMWNDPWEGLTNPSEMFDQHFGNLMPEAFRHFSRIPQVPSLTQQPRRPTPPAVVEQQSGVSQVTNNPKEFKICLDVQHFKPDEIDIKVRDNRLIIHAQHVERPDEHGFISREFTRQYVLPKDVDPATVVSNLTRDGILTLRGPKILPDAPKEFAIPINREIENEDKGQMDCKGDESGKGGKDHNGK